jgi:octaprenyl-diphosphate synthase
MPSYTPFLMVIATSHAPVAAILAESLGEVERIFERQLASEFDEVNALCRHVERYRGKMLRPTLAILSGLAAGRDPLDRATITAEHLTIAATVEMIHMATLVHDDVLDEAQVRRKGATLNALRGNEAAVMLGDYLISNAFHLCSRIGRPDLNLDLGAVTNTLCEGELVQLHHRDDLALDEATYFEIVKRKTAVLVGAACRLGARLSNAPEPVVAALGRFGIAAGIAFQVQDDLLDLEGREEVVGKSVGRDLEKGKMTLPTILHLASAAAGSRRDALAAIAARDDAALRTLVEESGAADEARRRAAGFVAEARGELSHLPASPVRDLLDELAQRVIRREY